MKNYIFALVLLLFFAGCATKGALQTQTALQSSKSCKVVFKTKKIAFADTGFLNKSPGEVSLQVFAMGTPVLKLKIKDEICLNGMCNSKRSFNQAHLSSYYPDTLMENVLNAKPILSSINLKKTVNGFTQNITGKWYKIKYKVDEENIYFKDSKNRIIIKIKGLK